MSKTELAFLILIGALLVGGIVFLRRLNK